MHVNMHAWKHLRAYICMHTKMCKHAYTHTFKRARANIHTHRIKYIGLHTNKHNTRESFFLFPTILAYQLSSLNVKFTPQVSSTAFLFLIKTFNNFCPVWRIVPCSLPVIHSHGLASMYWLYNVWNSCHKIHNIGMFSNNQDRCDFARYL